MKKCSEEEISDLLINRKISIRKHFIDLVLAKAIGKDYNKVANPNDFLPFLQDAITYAKELDVNQEDYPGSIGSHVYKLMEKLAVSR